MKDRYKTKAQLINELDKLRRVSARLDGILNLAEDAIISIDQNQKIILFNKGAEKIFGYSADEIMGKPLDILIPERLVEAHHAHIKNFARSPVSSRYMNERSNFFALRKDGTEFPAEASISRQGEGDEIVFTAILHDVSVQEKSRIKLENALSLLHATLEATADGIIAIDRSKKITNINRKFIEMWRIPDSVPETQDFKRLLEHVLAMAKEPESILEKVSQMEEHPEKVSRDFIEIKDGRVFERYCNPQQIEDEIIGNVCSFRDVTENRRLVDSLNESLSRLSKKNRYESIISSINSSVSESRNLQEFLDSIIDAMSKNIEASIISIYFVEGQEVVLKAHRGYPDWYIREAGKIMYPSGFTWKAIIENKPLLYCSDVDQDTAIGPAGRRLGTKSYVSMPFGYEGKVIGTINIHSSKRNAFDEEEIKLLETVAQQIERVIAKVRMAEVLRQSEERYRILFEQSPVGVYIFDRDLKVTHCNKRMVEILQTSYDNIIGFNIRDLNDKSFLPVTEKTIQGEHSYHEGLYQATTSQAKVWLSQYFSPLYDEKGSVVGGMGVAEDITERKQLEEQFNQAQKMEAVGRLAGGIAHDFNNLLTIILNYSDLLLSRTSLDRKQEESIRAIKNAGERTAALTSQLLAFSRKQLLQPKVLDLNDVVAGIENMLRSLIGEDIELVTELEPGLRRVKTDPGQIEQVIMNLAINARDAMPKGGKLLIQTANVYLEEAFASRHADVKPGRYVMLAVDDTGHGMDEDTLSQIFVPFFTTKELGKGTGLGLATVYGIINQSGGHIYVESEINRGTTFKIYLPEAKEYPQREEENIIAAKKAKGGPETILIAEDQDEVLTLVGMVLSDAGYKVLEANHCDVASQICEQYPDPIHLLLIDVVMPKMSGPELAKRLIDLHPEMKVLYMSGYIDITINQYGVLNNGTSFLQKPFTPPVLLSKVREVLDTS